METTEDVVYDIINQIVKRTLVNVTNELINLGYIFINPKDGKQYYQSKNQVYARVKLSVASYLLSECHEYTRLNYFIDKKHDVIEDAFVKLIRNGVLGEMYSGAALTSKTLNRMRDEQR
jgi:hypothetical protein